MPNRRTECNLVFHAAVIFSLACGKEGLPLASCWAQKGRTLVV